MLRRSAGGGTGTSQPVVQAIGWSIAVVFLGGVGGLAVTPGAPAQISLDQVPAAQDSAPEASAPGPIVEPGPAAPLGASPSGAGPGPSAAPAAPGATSSTSAGRRATSPTIAAAKAAAAKAAAPAPGAAPAPAARLQPDAGSYALRVTGTSSVDGRAVAVPTSARLVVQQQGATDQVHRTDGLPGGLVLVQRATPSGLDLLSFSLTASSRTLTFTPPSPLTFVRTDAPVGTSWSWTATSTDGSVTVSQTGTVTSIAPVTVAGTTVPAVTVSRVLTATGTVQGTLRLTSTVSLAERLPLVQHQALDVKATVLGLFSTRIVSDVTATLTSTRPQ